MAGTYRTSAAYCRRQPWNDCSWVISLCIVQVGEGVLQYALGTPA
ncbi:predicted protein [Histoplasma mississippiense (nom. inval.)]|nr:predicted protein [Histoplasma mississippiense (nom. inval.)]EDN08095.1 predicted protein [Histoplasma mississippiense (nom. inval.)]